MDESALSTGMIVLVLLFVLALSTVVMAFFAMTIQKLINRCAPQSRTMSPASAWLMLIPLFNHLWSFVLVYDVALSLDNEFALRKLEEEKSPGLTVGLTWAAAAIVSYIPLLPFRIIGGLICFICFVVYWIKIAGYSSQLEMMYMPASQTKKCPQCAEDVKVDALVCRFCQYRFG